jgi:hypothetical protein
MMEPNRKSSNRLLNLAPERPWAKARSHSRVLYPIDSLELGRLFGYRRETTAEGLIKTIGADRVLHLLICKVRP